MIPVVKLKHETANFGGLWYTDTAYFEVPPMATMLIAREVLPSGGDTLFASVAAAWEALSPGRQHQGRASAEQPAALSTSSRLHSPRGCGLGIPAFHTGMPHWAG